ncbi:hypothetical protein PIB30_022581 [Stylosanthes scabra]|uniref:Uncharacterized protein n=1 Tax=Stylosanthes scabra TaxID=79078 RepID=A0ABU6Z6S5_9FABA|nr:hypothetical protein [Stylosanthes scabra]
MTSAYAPKPLTAPINRGSTPFRRENNPSSILGIFNWFHPVTLFSKFARGSHSWFRAIYKELPLLSHAIHTTLMSVLSCKKTTLLHRLITSLKPLQYRHTTNSITLKHGGTISLLDGTLLSNNNRTKTDNHTPTASPRINKTRDTSHHIFAKTHQ